MSENFKAGEYAIVQIIKKRFLINLREGQTLHTNKGYINHNEIIGKPPGITLKTSQGFPAWAFRPSIRDFMMKTTRKTNIIYPKDAAFIIFYTGVKSGFKVLEIGSGSGSLTVALSYFVSPEGKVISYEKRGEFAQTTRENLIKANLLKYVEIREEDFSQAEPEKNFFEVAVIDIPTPWEIFSKVKECLVKGGFVVSFIPTAGQLEKTYLNLEKSGFAQIEALEILYRNWKVEKEATRPHFEMVAHTGFLVFARKAV
jgi:tRNA (adenine57-N1/adenine58-N1)-methyltransferase